MGGTGKHPVFPLEGHGLILPVIGKIIQVMVAEYKKKGLVQAGNHKVQVVHGQIPGAEYQIDAAETFFNGRRIYQGINLIGNAEDFHDPPLEMPIIAIISRFPILVLL
jgi:hypothetical protein